MKLSRLVLGTLLVVSLQMAACTVFASSVCTLDEHMPSFENSYETDHFVLKWTNQSRHSKDNISDPQIIKETA